MNRSPFQDSSASANQNEDGSVTVTLSLVKYFFKSSLFACFGFTILISQGAKHIIKNNIIFELILGVNTITNDKYVALAQILSQETRAI